MSDTSITQTTTADEVTIRGRIDEAQISYALPPMQQIHTVTDRSDIYRDNADLAAWASTQPPLVILAVATTADLERWAHQLDLVLSVNVSVVNGQVCRTIRARGTLLGWDVTARADDQHLTTITMPAPLAIVRRAHLGLL